MPKNDIDSTARSLRQVRSIGAQFQTRAAKDGEGPVIEGYFSVFNSDYPLWPGATEQVAPGAFAKSLAGDYGECDVRALAKQSPLNYEEKVRESARRALRRKLNAVAANAILASTLNTAHALEADKSATKGSVLFDEKLLSNIILAYGGDEGVEGSACLYLNKADLLAFAAIRGKNEYLPVYSITPDAANPSTGIIKDNNGLSCRYCLSKDLTALSTATLTTTATKHMFYGNPQCAELALWGGFEVEVNEGYKFAEGLLTVRGEVTADVDVTVKNGFVVVTAKKAAA